MTTETEPKPKKRRWLALSVRALMIAVLIFAGVLGWIVHRANVQRDAVAAIEKTGGTVRYEWQKPSGKPINFKAEPNWPKWLVDTLGVDYFGHVVMVNLGKSATDAEMAHVGQLSRLQGFEQGTATEITDAGAAHLAGLLELEHVGLSHTKVTGAVLSNLRGLTKINSLHLIGVPVGDADLANIEDFKLLEVLDLNETKVTDAGLAHLEGLVNLKQLRLVSTGIEGPGLVHLKGMDKLGWLLLQKTRVRDLSALPALPRLQWLSLDDAPVDDAGLAALPTLPRLTMIDFKRTNVTDAGVVHLLKFKNSLKIIRLEGPKITDASTPTFLKFDKLNQLELPGTNLTDAGLDQISGLKTIQLMDLEKTKVTDAGIARLRKAHPEFKLNSDLVAAARAKQKAQAQTKQPGAQL
jgi:hypothetical protein